MAKKKTALEWATELIEATRTTIIIPNKLLYRLRIQAAKEGDRSVTHLLLRIAEDYLKKKEPK